MKEFVRLFLGVVTCALAASAACAAPVDDARSKALKWLILHQRGDGAFATGKGIEIQTTAATIDAMVAGGMASSPQLAFAADWLANTPASSTDALSWQAAGLARAGRNALTPGQKVRDSRNALVIVNGSIHGASVPVAVWGPYRGYTGSVTDTALGFGALRASGVTYTNDALERTATALCVLLPAQLTTPPWNGSWPYAFPQSAQPSATAVGAALSTSLALYEIKRALQAGRFLGGGVCNRTSPGDITTAANQAKTWLIAQANADGGFAERNPQTGALEASNPLTSAFVVRALALYAAEGDPAAASAVNVANNYLVGKQSTDGSWGGDALLTARVAAALPTAAGTYVADNDGDGLPNVVEQLLGTNTNVADSQTPLPKDSNAKPGTTATQFAATGTVNTPFSFALPVSGTGPFSFVRTAGTLPPGLTLAANGQISGIPTQAGNFAFDYQITDASSAAALVIGRIDITSQQAQGITESDAPLPVWALAALVAGLYAVRRRLYT